MPRHLIVERGDPGLALHVEHLAGRRVRPPAVEAERDPPGLLANRHLRHLSRRHHGVVEDVHQLVVPVTDPELSPVGRQTDAVARTAVPLDRSLFHALDLYAMKLPASPQIAD